jgi:hypothetical protein
MWLTQTMPARSDFYCAHGFENVARPDGGCQSVGRIVRDLERIFFVVKRYHGCNRTKNLFARNAGIVIHVVEDGGLHIVTLGKFFSASTTRCNLGFFLADFEVGVHAVVLFFADQRAHFCFAFEWRPDLYFLRLFSHGFDELFVDRFLHQDAAARRADFSLIDKDAEQGAIDGGFEVGVGKEDVGRLASEFSVTRFTVSAASFTMILPTVADPVKAILLTSGCFTSGDPQVSPKPVITFTTPLGRPTHRTTSRVQER